VEHHRVPAQTIVHIDSGLVLVRSGNTSVTWCR
jgi:hypothetical protein